MEPKGESAQRYLLWFVLSPHSMLALWIRHNSAFSLEKNRQAGTVCFVDYDLQSTVAA